MADNIKISELVELTSGSLGDATIFPVVDGGSTKKASLSSLQSYLTDDLATDAELSSQISSVNSTITGLDTDDIAEGSNQYFTNARVDDRISSLGAITESAGVDLPSTSNYISGIKSRLNAETVISSSAQISSSAAAAGFGAGGGGGGTADYTQLTNVPSGIVSSSIQVTYTGLSGIPDGIVSSSTQISASAAASGFGAGGEGGGGNDYISDVSLNNSTLTFTGVGSAFNTTINLAAGEADGGNLLTTADAGNFLGTATYETDSGSFASRLDSAGGGGGSTPAGTVSSSAQTIENLGGTGILSGSLDVSQLDLSNTTTDDITEGTINKYYANSLVLPYLNTLQVNSGSGGGGGDYNSLINKPSFIVSSSVQIENLGFPTNAIFGSGTASLQQQINDITASQASVTVNDVNVFTAKQKFEQDIEVTGSILLSGAGKHFSGSGAQLFNIPSTAIVGAGTDNSIVDGDNSVIVDNVTGVNVTLSTGQLFVTGGDVYVTGGAFSGSGAGLVDIPGSAILGGVDGQKISSGSFSASIEDGTGNLIVGPFAIFESNVYASGSVTAQSISVGTSGTPTVYSSTNLNLSASNAVVVTDSPMRLNPFAAADTASFTLAEGDMVFSSDDNDFFGYRIVNQTGSWYSLTAGTVTSVEWDTIIGAPGGLVSSSEQIVGVGNTLLSSSAQLLPSGAVPGTVYFEDTLDNISGSSDFTYTAGTRTLNVNKVVANELVYNTSLTGAGNDTGSYGRVETDALNINSAIEFPTSDGTTNQVLKTDGNGNLDFAAFADVLGNDNITTAGTVTMGTGSVNTNLTVGGTFNIGSPVHSTFNNQSITIDSANVNILSSGSLLLSSSIEVKIQDVLVLPQRTTNPSNPADGSMIVSSSAGQLRPYFWDGSAWKGISFTS